MRNAVIGGTLLAGSAVIADAPDTALLPALLRRLFPRSWQSLVRVKALVDRIASLDAPAAMSRAVHQRRIAQLLVAAAQELNRFAMADNSGPGGTARAQARVAAYRLRLFAESGGWPPVILRPPGPGEPWLYCGPLNTWAMHATRPPLGFLLVSPRPDLQAEPDAADANTGTVQAAIAAASGGAIRSAGDIRPTMHVTDMLLTSGDSSAGHKRFAHFFPLETPALPVDGPGFTVVFSNALAS
jgi:hypothetical protein